jgi:hypothetical protein
MAALLLCLPVVAAGQSPDALVTRIGAYVARYYERTHSIVADEHVRVQPLRRDLSLEGFARRLVYELRIEWNPDAGPDEEPATITRRLIRVNDGPVPDDAERECLDLHTVSPAPLAFLLPGARDAFRFREVGPGSTAGRPAVLVDYRALTPEPPVAEWNDSCVSVDLPGRARGRLWADPETGEVLRLEEGITGIVEIPVPVEQQRRGAFRSLTLDRSDTSIEYRHVEFTDPAETVLLPARIQTMTVWRNAGSARVLTTQTFDNYRRFVTGTRIVR